MPPAFRASDLTDSDIARAVPLLQTIWPKARLADWQEFLAVFRGGEADDQTEIVGLYDEAGSLCGLFAARIEQSFPEGRVLSIPLFTVVDVANSLEPIRVLVDAAIALAVARGCAGLELRLGKDQAGLVRRLNGLGLQRAAVLHTLAIAVH